MKGANTLDRRGPHAKPEVHEQDVTVRGCRVALRQIAVRGLGHEHPTLILTNDRDSTPKKVVGRYAKRMAIEQRLAESIRGSRPPARTGHGCGARNAQPSPGSTGSTWVPADCASAASTV